MIIMVNALKRATHLMLASGGWIIVMINDSGGATGGSAALAAAAVRIVPAGEASLCLTASGTLGHCYIALFLDIYHLGYIAPAKLLYSKGAISILCYIAT